MKLTVAAALVIVSCSGPTDDADASDPDGATTTSSVSAGQIESGLTCWTSSGGGGQGVAVFADVTSELGLDEPLRGMHGHAAIWTDVDGDENPDIFVGTYADREADIYQQRGAPGPSPDKLLIGGEPFSIADDLADAFSRSSGGVSADLDNDGDLDLVVTRNIKDPSLGQTPTQILENDGGRLVAVPDAGFPDQLGGRAVGVLDYDRDGLLDLVVTEDRWAGGSSVLMHNDGGLRFSDATAGSGIPDDVHGLGVAVADFDGNGSHDVFISGSNRLFFSDGDGGFVEQDSTVFQWEVFGAEDDVAGATVADVNRDGWLDLAVGHHYNSTLEFGEMVSVRLYLNDSGEFTDVTDAAGLVPLPTKAPHVELNDFDNDGWPDLLTSAAADDGPAIFTHDGLEGGVPRYTTPDGLGPAQYWVGAPTVDIDRDGRLDVFLLEWEPALPSRMMRNETDGGHWLQVSVDGHNGFGIGWRVELLDDGELIGARDITVTQGYSSGVLPVAHFGTGDVESVDVRLTPPGEDAIVLDSVMTDRHIRWPAGCG